MSDVQLICGDCLTVMATHRTRAATATAAIGDRMSVDVYPGIKIFQRIIELQQRAANWKRAAKHEHLLRRLAEAKATYYEDAYQQLRDG